MDAERVVADDVLVGRSVPSRRTPVVLNPRKGQEKQRVCTLLARADGERLPPIPQLLEAFLASPRLAVEEVLDAREAERPAVGCLGDGGLLRQPGNLGPGEAGAVSEGMGLPRPTS